MVENSDHQELKDLLCNMLLSAQNDDRENYRIYQDEFLARYSQEFGQQTKTEPGAVLRKIYKVIDRSMSRKPEKPIEDSLYLKEKQSLLEKADQLLLALGKDC